MAVIRLMKHTLTPLLILTVALVWLLMFAEPAAAQCPMCKAAVETSLQQGDNTAVGLNKGILYLLVMPYILYALIFLAWYRGQKRKVVTY